MPDYLFVYGTLRPGCAPAEIAEAAAQLSLVGDATVGGDLYDLGHYPGAVLSSVPAHTIAGQLFKLPEDEAVLHALDEYEEFLPELPATSQFLRVRCEATLGSGETIPCWIYVYARPLAGVPPILSGTWRSKQ